MICLNSRKEIRRTLSISPLKESEYMIMCAIRMRGDTYQVDLNLKDTPRYRKGGFKTKEDARVHEATIKAKLLQGEPVDTSVCSRVDGITLETLLDETIERYWQGTPSEDTATCNAMSCIEFLGKNKSPDSLEQKDIDSLIRYFRTERRIADSTINRKLASLSKMIQYGKSVGLIKSSLQLRIDWLKESKGRIRWVTGQEEETMKRYCNQHETTECRHLWFFLMDTGLRRGEALQFDPQRDYQDRKINVWETKADHPRTVPCTDRVVHLIETERVDFRSLSKATVRYRWDRMKSWMGLHEDEQFVPHCLRHTFCSRLVQRGVPILTVQKLAGHKSISQTMRYSHLHDDDLVEAISKL